MCDYKQTMGRTILFMILVFFFYSGRAEAQEKTIHIMLDAGHGGSQSGMEIETEKGTVSEKNLNLKIVQYLSNELEKYENVNVSMTRTDDSDLALLRRTEIAKENNADILISIHNNAKGDCCAYDNGCTVLVSKGAYRDELAELEQKLACNLLYELSQLGIENQGMLLRDSENGEMYPNDTVADYYAIVRNGIKMNIPSVIIEHSFMDNANDYDNYLSSDEKLKKLAKADARGIARFYQLKNKENQEILENLKNRKEKMVLVKDGQSENNEVSYKWFYQQEVDEQTEIKKEQVASTQKEVIQEQKDKSENNTIIKKQKDETKIPKLCVWISFFVIASIGIAVVVYKHWID